MAGPEEGKGEVPKSKGGSIGKGAIMTTGFSSPFNGDSEKSRLIIPKELGLLRIRDLPVSVVRIRYTNGFMLVVDVDDGNMYAAAFLLYLLKRYGTQEEIESEILSIRREMSVDYMLFYGFGDEKIPISMTPLLDIFEDCYDTAVTVELLGVDH